MKQVSSKISKTLCVNRFSFNIEGKDGISGGLESADVWGDEADVSLKIYFRA